MSLARDIVGENVRIKRFVAGAPDLTKDMRTARGLPRSPAIEILFSVGDKIVARAGVARNPYRPIWGVEAAGKRVEIPGFADRLSNAAM
jgi:hypothetical protein